MPLARPHNAANITTAGGAVANRRSILVSGAQLAGAAAFMPCMMGPAASAASNPEAAAQGSGGAVRLAQAGVPGSRAAARGASPLAVKSVARLARTLPLRRCKWLADLDCFIEA